MADAPLVFFNEVKPLIAILKAGAIDCRANLGVGRHCIPTSHARRHQRSNWILKLTRS
jgi:hypothetical protein